MANKRSRFRSGRWKRRGRSIWESLTWKSISSDPLHYVTTFEEIPVRKRLGLVLVAILTIFGLWGYYILSSHPDMPYVVYLGLYLCFLVYGTAMAILVRVRSIVVLTIYALVGLSTYLHIFSYTYWAISHEYADCVYVNDVLSPLSRVDSFYFTVTTMTTTGFGDISPKNGICRGIVAAQMMTGFLFFAVFAALLITQFAATLSSSRRDGATQNHLE